jgi:hypothetical protein
LEWRKSPDCISTVYSSLACTTRTIPYDPYLNCICHKTMNQDEILLFCECRAVRLSSNFVRTVSLEHKQALYRPVTPKVFMINVSKTPGQGNLAPKLIADPRRVTGEAAVRLRNIFGSLLSNSNLYTN